MSGFNGQIIGTNILIFPVLDESIQQGYPVTGYRVQDIGIATQILFMHQDTDYQTAPVMHGEDFGKSVYSQDRSIYQHFQLETAGSGGELYKDIRQDRHHS